MKESLFKRGGDRLRARRGGVGRWLCYVVGVPAIPLLVWLVWSEPRPAWLLVMAGAFLLLELSDPLWPRPTARDEEDLRRKDRAALRASIRRFQDGSVDWSTMDYFTVSRVANLEPPRTLEALLGGPLKRIFDICEDETGIRVAARAMEFAPGPVARLKDRHARSESQAREVDAAVMAELERRFGKRGSDGRYLVDCYLGKRTHNG
ncbi:hypothetical protein GCM10009116_10050 [Brevundimonas basaltis]|uniref:Uncharacterized protein n=1 Tax=Brevundimonas basaltis TaxID=472166 RepID=A0A7W8HY57_9CAUL|nr:hypothetical protein [Brevundimonas basaltis]MBB5292071.1 hypothetical protein [Brevundimonas basaltis]